MKCVQRDVSRTDKRLLCPTAANTPARPPQCHVDRTRVRLCRAVRSVRADATRRAGRLGSPEEEGVAGVCRSAGLRDTPWVCHLQGRPQGSAAPGVHCARYGSTPSRRLRSCAETTAPGRVGIITLACVCCLVLDLLERCSEEEEEEEAGACSDGEPGCLSE